MIDKENEDMIELTTTPRSVTVDLRIYHANLAGSVVSKQLNLEPTKCNEKDDPLFFEGRPTGRRARISARILSSKEFVHTFTLDDHMNWMLEKLKGKQRELQALRDQGHRIDLCCVWHASSINTCPSLTAGMMSEISKLDLPLWFDIYFSN